jgi:hypothetical protein
MNTVPVAYRSETSPPNEPRWYYDCLKEIGGKIEPQKVIRASLVVRRLQVTSHFNFDCMLDNCEWYGPVPEVRAR